MKKFGKPIGELRRDWKREGRCPRCGAGLAPDENTCKDCRQKHAARRRRNLHGTGPRPVLIQVPRDLYGKIKADAVERNETVEQWIPAECQAAFDDEKEGNEKAEG